MRVILFLISLTALMGLFQLPSLQEWAQWDHSAITSGQWWRIVTGNLTHTNLYHLGMNILGLWIISFIFYTQLHWRSFILLLIGLCISIGSLLLFTSMQIYVGLSGVLHGLFGFYAIQEYRLGKKSSAYLIIVLAAKVAWEQYVGSSTSSEALIGAKIAINAHFFGALSGVISATLVKPIKNINKKSSSHFN